MYVKPIDVLQGIERVCGHVSSTQMRLLLRHIDTNSIETLVSSVLMNVYCH